MSVHLEEMLAACKPYTQQGQLPSYIPALKKGDPKHLGVCLLSCDGQLIQAGDCGVQFSIQSIVKPILLLQALLDNGQTVALPRTAATEFKKAWGNYWLTETNK